MADINLETERLAEIMAEVNRQMRDFGQVTQQTKDQLFDAQVEQKSGILGIKNATMAVNSAGQAVGNLAKAAGSAASELYNGKKGAAAFNGAVDGMSEAMQNGAKTIGTMFPAFKGVAVAFSLATQAVTAYAKAANVMADGLYKGYQGLAKSGAAASDGMSGLFSDTKKLGLSMSELDGFVNLIGENSRDLALFAGSVSQGRKRFAEIGAAMDGPVRTGLMNLGMSVQDIADGTAGYLRLQTRLGRSQNMTNDELAAGAARYLKEQDALSRVTGQSRKEMEAATERALLGEQFAAKIRQLEMSGQGEAAAKLIEMNKIYEAAGPKTAAGFQAIVTGNLVNKDAQDLFRSSQGEALRSTQRVIAGQQEMGDAVQGTLRIIGKTTDTLGTTLGQMGVNDKNFIPISEGIKARVLSEGNLADNLKKQAAEQAKMGADGSKHADAMTANQVKIVDTQIKINLALENFVRDGIEPTQRAMQKLANIALKGAGAAEGMGPKGVATLGATVAGAGMGAVKGGTMGLAMGGPVGAAIGGAIGLIGGGIAAHLAANAASDAIGLPGRSKGSLGATGKLIEDFGKGTPMMLHGREGIVTEKQLHEFGNSAMAAGRGTGSEQAAGITPAQLREFGNMVSSLGANINTNSESGPTGALGQADEKIRRLVRENRRTLEKQVAMEEKILDSKTAHYDFMVSQIDAIEFKTTQETRSAADDLKNIKDFASTRDRLMNDILTNIRSQVTSTADAAGVSASSTPATGTAGDSAGSAGGAGGAVGSSAGGAGGAVGGKQANVPPGPSAPSEVEGARGGSDAKASDVLEFTARSGSSGAFEGLDNRVKSATIAAAEQYLATTGKKFQINSAKRDPADQLRLYNQSVALGTPGRGPTGMAVAKPGRSPHEHGLAVDIQNYRDPAAVAAMNRQGLSQKVPGDPVHFSFGDGGIASGPTTGYLAELHGPEAVVPLPDGKTIPVRLENPGDLGGNSASVKNEMQQMMAEFKSAMQGMVEQMNNKAMITVLDEMVRAQKTGNDIQKKMLLAQN